MTPWTRAEEALLATNYQTLGPRETAQLLGRSVRAVWTRASLLGVTEKDPLRAQRFAYPHVARS